MIEWLRTQAWWPRFAARVFDVAPITLQQGLLRRQEAQRFQTVIQPGDLVFDIGANVGLRTRTFVALGARVVAVEPQPECAQRLRTAFARSGHVSVVEAAVGAAPGQAELHMSDNSPFASMSAAWMNAATTSGVVRSDMWDSTISVEVTTLDALIDGYGVPAFCKIDIEGWEEEAVRGLSKPVRCLSFEFHGVTLDASEGVAHRLEQIGMTEFNFSREEMTSFALPRWVCRADAFAELRNGLAPDDWGDIYARLPQ